MMTEFLIVATNSTYGEPCLAEYVLGIESAGEAHEKSTLRDRDVAVLKRDIYNLDTWHRVGQFVFKEIREKLWEAA